MKEYLAASMDEQIHRGKALINLIEHPLPPELDVLAQRCTNLIQEQIDCLGQLKYVVGSANGTEIRYILRKFRECTRNLEMVEAFGISALYYKTWQLGYFNKLIKEVQKEISLPIICPSVACTSIRYYYFHSYTDVIFIPLAESDFLLNLPDLFHEIGHAVLNQKDKTPKLSKLNEAYKEIINLITEYYIDLKEQKTRETGPEGIIYNIELWHSNWKECWVDEYLANLFALYTLGPAFVNTHLHLVTKTSDDIYSVPRLLRQTHPSDDSQFKLLLTGMELIGYTQETSIIRSRWESMPFCQRASPPPDYHFAYPPRLLEQIANIFLKGLNESGIAISTKKNVKDLEKNSIILMLNNAWNQFWETPNDFREWEKEKLKELKIRYGFNE